MLQFCDLYHFPKCVQATIQRYKQTQCYSTRMRHMVSDVSQAIDPIWGWVILYGLLSDNKYISVCARHANVCVSESCKSLTVRYHRNQEPGSPSIPILKCECSFFKHYRTVFADSKQLFYSTYWYCALMYVWLLPYFAIGEINDILVRTWSNYLPHVLNYDEAHAYISSNLPEGN